MVSAREQHRDRLGPEQGHLSQQDRTGGGGQLQHLVEVHHHHAGLAGDRCEFGQQLFGGSEVEHPLGMHHPDAAAQLLEDAGLGGVSPAAGAAVAAGVAAADRVDRPGVLVVEVQPEPFGEFFAHFDAPHAVAEGIEPR